MKRPTIMPRPDGLLLFGVISLLVVGLLMVSSTSIVIAEQHYGAPFHFIIRQSLYILMAVSLGFGVLQIPLAFWYRVTVPLLLLTIFLLILVLIPGVGHTVNGSRRWINFIIFRFQPSELAKLVTILYIARYIVRQQTALSHSLSALLKPMSVVFLMAILFLGEPDFGGAVVMLLTAFGLLYLGGGKWTHAVGLLLFLGALFGLAMFASPYRMARLTGFLNPWANAFDSGYQLTQSLIAFGRGGWFGVGLGESVQKLFYLPEAHTDFIFAVLAEELGLLGVLGVMALYATVLTRAFSIGRFSEKNGESYHAFVAYGIALWLGLQVMINIGVNGGVLPTKGLTLPLLSYGGNSLLIMGIAVGLLLRVHYENQTQRNSTNNL